MSDRVAALTLLVQESPIHRTQHLDQLLQMAGKQSRRESMPVLLALQDLFLTDLLPDRKLLFFRENAFKQPCDVEQEALFQFEHTLKLGCDPPSASIPFNAALMLQILCYCCCIATLMLLLLCCNAHAAVQVRRVHQSAGVCAARPCCAH